MISAQLNLVSTQLKMDGLRSAQVNAIVRSKFDFYIHSNDARISQSLARQKNIIQFEIVEVIGVRRLLDAFQFHGFKDPSILKSFYDESAPSWTILHFIDEHFFITILANIENKQGENLFDKCIDYLQRSTATVHYRADHDGFRNEEATVPIPTEKQFFAGIPYILRNSRFAISTID